MNLHNRSGFTLVETMVAIVMLMIVIGSVYGMLRGADQSISRTEERADIYQTARILLAQIHAELSSAYQMPEDKTSDLVGVDNEGGKGALQYDKLTFLTTAHQPVLGAEAAGDVCQVTYMVASTSDDKPLGLFVEEDFQPGLSLEAGKPEPVRLSKLVVGLNCKYLDGMTGEWRDDWVEQKGLPRAVRVELALKPEREGAKPIVIASTANLPAISFPNQQAAQGEPTR